MKTTINALDPSQKFILEELTKGGADDLSLVYGPPGTGKSHLIVSLLFELACSGKKVLFVSQNREAIEVVIRKYRDIDRSMGLGDTDVTFLDFCLHLSDRSQRTIKYISSLRSRLFSKYIRRITSIEEIDNEIPYALYYRELDKEKNYNSTSESDIGLDMLLANQLAFVKNGKIIKKILHRSEDIDARGVFSLLREHKTRAENFKIFNNPSNELRFLNRVNDSALTISRLHDVIYAITDACRKNPAILEMSYVKDNDIRNVLHFIAMLKEISRAYKIYEVKNDPVDFETIFSNIKQIQKGNKSLQLSVELGQIELPDEAISTKSASRYIKEYSNIEALKKYKTDLNETALCIVMSGYSDSNLTILQLATNAMASLDLGLDEIDSIIDIGLADGETIRRFVRDVTEWRQRGVLTKVFSQKPESLSDLSEKDIASIEGYCNALLIIADILDQTNLKYKDIRKVTKDHIRERRKIDCEKRKSVKIATCCLNASFNNLSEQSRKYTCKEFCEFVKESTKLIDVITGVYSRDKTIAGKPIADGMRIIDENIEARALRSKNDEIYDGIKKYIANTKSGWLKLPAMSDKPKLIDIIIRDINFDDSFDDVDAEKLKVARDAIDEAADKKIFSSDFYKLAAGEKIKMWVDRIESLLAFEDRDAFGDFIAHNDFIMKLGKALGPTNKDYLESYLEMELDYDEFSEHIAYDLIRSLYGNIPTSKCRSIKSKQYFDDFSKNLERARR